MSKYVELICALCGKKFQRAVSEHKRSLKRGRASFCGASCATRATNNARSDRTREVEKVCPQCGTVFSTRTGKGEAMFCSRSCASKGSVNAARRAAGRYAGALNAHAIRTPAAHAAGLRQREMWKYQKLADHLDARGERFVFEFPLGDRVFDLALEDRKVLVEFDTPYHVNPEQQKRDAEKDVLAAAGGWCVVRISVPTGEVDPACLHGVISRRCP